MKEAFKGGKNQVQVGHVNAFGPGHTEDGLLLQLRKKIKEEEASNNVPKIKVIINCYYTMYMKPDKREVKNKAKDMIQK